MEGSVATDEGEETPVLVAEQALEDISDSSKATSHSNASGEVQGEGAHPRIDADDKLGDEASKPLVGRIDGNNVEEGRRILAERQHPLVTIEKTMDGGARRAAELAAAAK